MPTTRKQEKTRKSRGIEMLSDIENLDIMLGKITSTEMEEMIALVVIVPEGQKVPLKMTLKITMETGT